MDAKFIDTSIGSIFHLAMMMIGDLIGSPLLFHGKIGIGGFVLDANDVCLNVLVPFGTNQQQEKEKEKEKKTIKNQ